MVCRRTGGARVEAIAAFGVAREVSCGLVRGLQPASVAARAMTAITLIGSDRSAADRRLSEGAMVALAGAPPSRKQRRCRLAWCRRVD